VPKSSGENFHPHVSTGVATKEYLDRMLAEPFKTFTSHPQARLFTSSATSVRQRGNSSSSI